MVIRTLKDHELGPAKKIWETCFDDEPPFVEWYFKNRIKPEEVMGYFKPRAPHSKSDSLVADLHMAPYQLRLQNRVFSSVYIIALATIPTERRKGIAKELLKFTLEYLAEKGIFITILMPFNLQFYTRLGWGIIFRHQNIQFKPAPEQSIENLTTPALNHAENLTGEIKVFNENNFINETPPKIETLSKVYNKWAERFYGNLLRSTDDWEGLLFDHYMDAGEIRLFFNKQGEAEGYALSRRKEKKTIIREIAYTTLQAGENLLQTTLPGKTPLDSQSDFIWSAPVHDSLIDLIVKGNERAKNLRQKSLTVNKTFFMLGRITDIVSFIKQLPAPDVRFNLYLEINDPLLPRNCGTFHLSSGGNGVFEIMPSTKEPEVRCDISLLTELLSGEADSSCEKLLTICRTSPELLWVRKEESLLLLKNIFPPVINYMNDYF